MRIGLRWYFRLEVRVPICSEFYFWRTASAAEVDLLVVGSEILPIDVKLHSAPGTDSATGLRRCMHDLRLKRIRLVYPAGKAIHWAQASPQFRQCWLCRPLRLGEVRGVRCEVRGARCEVRGVRCEVRGARCEV